MAIQWVFSGSVASLPFATHTSKGVSKRIASGESVKNDSYLFLWDRISKIVRNYTKGMEVVADEPGNLRVEANNGRPFVCVRIQKKHVGIYLLPLYYHPETLPQTLSKNKSGKGTLRFKSKEEFSVKDIERLIENCLAVIGHY